MLDTAFDADLRADALGRNMHRGRNGPLDFAQHDRHSQRSPQKRKTGPNDALQRSIVGLFRRDQIGNRRRQLVQIGQAGRTPAPAARRAFLRRRM